VSAIPYQSSLQGTFTPEPWPEQEALTHLRRKNFNGPLQRTQEYVKGKGQFVTMAGNADK